ncbi:MAG: DUF4347 domain-containing protein [Desulfovibrio desulfuricans]|nr:DUF4347 domain-containing protein [Desulfovibrio desulfuricans]
MSQQVFFVDASVAGAGELKSALELSVGEGSKVFVLENNSAAFQQMDAALATLTEPVSAVHIYAHGAAGSVTLGGRRVDQAALDESAAILDKIGNYLTEDGDILLYSCNTAQGAAGQSFIQRLAALTRADVAASTDVTGRAGNWVLEKAAGVIETPVREPSNFSGNLDVAPLDGAGIIEAAADNEGGKISGSVARDYIYGYGGEHTMVGGDGSDVYYVRRLGTQSAKNTTIVEAPNEGNDTVVSQIADLDLSSSSTSDGGNDSMSAIENIVLQADGSMVTQNVKGNDFSQTIAGNALGNKIVGMGGNDSLDGGDGDDFLDGGDGKLSGTTDYGTDKSDTLAGGKGDDQFVVRNVNDVVAEAANQGTDHVYSFIDYTLGANVENLTLLDGTDTEHAADAYGNQLDNELKGNRYANYLWGGAGNDTLYGGKAADEAPDTLDGGAGNDLYFVYTDKDKIVDTAGNDTIVSTGDYDLRNAANVEALHLVGDATVATGNSLNNYLRGNESLGSTLDGVSGNNTLEGGSKADTFVVRNSGETIIDAGGKNVVLAHATVNLNAGNFSKAVLDRVELQGDASLSATAKTTVATTLVGNAGNNTLTGGNLGDVLDDGGAGVNSLAGGAGNDYYVVGSENTAIRENANAGSDTVEAWTRDYALGDNVEHFILKENDDIKAASEGISRTATGNSLANDIDASAVTTEVVLRGTANAAGERGDTLRGGSGMNHFYTYQKSDEIRLGVGGAGAKNYIYINYDVENGAGKDKEAWAAYLGLDADRIDGVKYLGAPDAQKRTGITATTSADAPYLVGTDYGDVLKAGDGVASTLDGGKGNDTMTGGGKADVFYIDSAQDVVSGGANTVTDAAGNKVYDTVRATANVDFVSTYTDADRTVRSRISGDVGSVELLGSAALSVTGSNLSTVASAYRGAENALKITGNAGRNQLTGTRYDDTIDAGEGGSATMKGGAGNDFYYVRNSADQVQGEDANGGDDTVQTYGVHVNLGTTFRNVEHVVNMGGAVSMTGAGNGGNLTAAEEFTAGAFGDSIDGKGGEDTITRGAGADVVYYYGSETVNAAGNDEADHADTLILSKTPAAFADAEGLNSVAGTFGAVSMESGGKADIGLDVSFAAHDMTITGNAGNNAIKAGSGNDVIYGGGGSDKIDAGEGDDYAEAVLATVEDYQTTEDGATTRHLAGGEGQDTLSFGAGNQTIVFESHDAVGGQAGLTTFTQKGLKQTVTVNGRTSLAAADTVAVGVTGFEAYDGGAGNDSLDARLLNAGIMLAGGAGNDTLIGGAGDDTLVADGGSDTLTTGKGTNIIRVTAEARGGTITVTDYARLNNSEGTTDCIDDSALSGWERSVTKVNADVQIVWTNPDKTSEKVTMRLLNADVSDVRWIQGALFDENGVFDGSVPGKNNLPWNVSTTMAGQTIIGGAKADTLSDAFGYAFISGNAGDDKITAVASDSVLGGDGDDTILIRGVSGGEAGSYTSVMPGSGSNRIELEQLGGDGKTLINCGSGDDLFVVRGLAAGTGEIGIIARDGTDTLRFDGFRDGVKIIGTDTQHFELTDKAAGGATVVAKVRSVEAFEGTAAADHVDLTSYASGAAYRTGGGNDHVTGAAAGGNTVIVDGAFTGGATAEERLTLDGGGNSGGGNTLMVELAGATLHLGEGMTLSHNGQTSGALTNFQRVTLASNAARAAAVEVDESWQANGLAVTTGSGNDSFTIGGTDFTASGRDLTLGGGAGDDVFTLSNLPLSSLSGSGSLALKGGAGVNTLVLQNADMPNTLDFDRSGRLYAFGDWTGAARIADAEGEAGLYLEGVSRYVSQNSNSDAEHTDSAVAFYLSDGLASGANLSLEGGENSTFYLGAVDEGARLAIRGGSGAGDALEFIPRLPSAQDGGNLLYLTMQADGSFTAAYADTDDASRAVANITGGGIEEFTLGGGRIVRSAPGNTSPVNANVFNAALYTGGLVIYTGVNRDVVTGGKGDDTFYLSTGDDVITLNGGNDTLVLTTDAIGDQGSPHTTVKGKFVATVDGENMLKDDELIDAHYIRTVSNNTTLGSKQGIQVVYSKQGVYDIVLLFEDNRLGDISNKALAGATLNLDVAGWTGEVKASDVTTSITASAAVGDVTVTGGAALAEVDFHTSAGSLVYTDAGPAHAQRVTGVNVARAAKGKWDNMITVNGGLSSTVAVDADDVAKAEAVAAGKVDVYGGKGRDRVLVKGGNIGTASLEYPYREYAAYTLSTGEGDDAVTVANGDGAAVNSGTLIIDAGRGADAVTVGDIAGGQVAVFGGKGNDTIAVGDIAGGAVYVRGRWEKEDSLPEADDENFAFVTAAEQPYGEAFDRSTNSDPDNDTITLGAITGGVVDVEGNGGDNAITVKSISGGEVSLGGGASKTTITVTEGISGGTVKMDGDEGVNAFNMGAVSGTARVEARGYHNSVNTFNIESAAAGTVVALYGDGGNCNLDGNTDTLNFIGTATGVKADFDAGVIVSPLDGISPLPGYAAIGLSGVEVVNGTALADEFVLEGFIGSKLTINGMGGGDSFTACDWDGCIGSGSYGHNTWPGFVQQVTVNFTGGGNTATVGLVDAKSDDGKQQSRLTVSGDGKKDADGKGDTLVIDGTAAIDGMTPTGVSFELNGYGQLTGADLKDGEPQLGSLMFCSWDGQATQGTGTASHVVTTNIYNYALKAASGSYNILDAHAYKGAVTLSADNGANTFIGGGSTATRMTGGSGSDTFRLTGNVGLVDGGEGRDTVNLFDQNGTSYTLAGSGDALTLSGGVAATLRNIEEIQFKAGTTLTLNAAAGIPVITLAADAGRKDTLHLGANMAGNTVNVNGFNLADDVITGGTLTGTTQDGETTIRTYSLTGGGSVDVILHGVQDHSADSTGDVRSLTGGAVYFGSAHADTVTLSLGATGSFVDLKGNDEAGGEETLTVTLDGAQPHYGASTLRSSGGMAAGATSVLAVDNAGFGGGATLAFKNTGGVATLSSITLKDGSAVHKAELATSGFTAYRGTTAADAVTATAGGALTYETGGGADNVTAGSGNDAITVTTLVTGTNINTGSGTDTICIKGVEDHQYDSGTTLFKATGRGILSFAGDTPVQMAIWNSGTRADITMAGHEFQDLTLNGFTQFAGSGGNDAFTFASWANNPTFDGGDGDDTAEFRYLGNMADKKFAVFQVGSASGDIQVQRGYRGNTVGSYVIESGYVTLKNMETLQGTAGIRDMFRIKELNSATAAPTYKAASNGECDNVRIRGIAAATKANAVTLKAEGSADRGSDMEVSFFGSYGDEDHTIQGVRLELKKDDVWAVLGDLGYNVYAAAANTSKKQARLDLTGVYGLGGTDAKDMFVLHSDYDDFFAGDPDYALVLDGGTGVDVFTMAAPETGTAWGNQTLTFGAGDDAKGAWLTNAGNHTTRFISVEQFNIVGDSVTLQSRVNNSEADGVFVLDGDTIVTADALAADGTVTVNFSGGVTVGAGKTFTYTGSATKADTVTLGEVSGGTKFDKRETNPTRYLKMDAGAGAGDVLTLHAGVAADGEDKDVAVHIDGKGNVVALGWGEKTITDYTYSASYMARQNRQHVLLSGFETIVGDSAYGTQFRISDELASDLTLTGMSTSQLQGSERDFFAINTVKAGHTLKLNSQNGALKLNKKTDNSIIATVHMDAGDSANNRVTFAKANAAATYGTVDYGKVKTFVGNDPDEAKSDTDNKGTNIFEYTTKQAVSGTVLNLGLSSGEQYGSELWQLNIGASDAAVRAMDKVVFRTAEEDATTYRLVGDDEQGALSLNGNVNLDFSGMANGGAVDFSNGLSLGFITVTDTEENEWTMTPTGALTFTGSATGADRVTLGELVVGTEFHSKETNPTRYLKMDAGAGAGDTLILAGGSDNSRDVSVHIDGSGSVVGLGYGEDADAASDAKQNVLLSGFEEISGGSVTGTQFRVIGELERNLTLKAATLSDGGSFSEGNTFAVNTVKAGAVLTIADASAYDVLKLNKKTDDDITATVHMDAGNSANNRVTFAKANAATTYGTVDYGNVKRFVGNVYNTPYSHADNKSMGTNVFEFTTAAYGDLALGLTTGRHYGSEWTQLNVGEGGSYASILAMDRDVFRTADGSSAGYNLTLEENATLTLRGDMNLDLSGMANGGAADFSNGLNFLGEVWKNDEPVQGTTGTLSFTGSADGADTVTLGELSGLSTTSILLSVSGGDGDGVEDVLTFTTGGHVRFNAAGAIYQVHYAAHPEIANTAKNVNLSGFEKVTCNSGLVFDARSTTTKAMTFEGGIAQDTYCINKTNNITIVDEDFTVGDKVVLFGFASGDNALARTAAGDKTTFEGLRFAFDGGMLTVTSAEANVNARKTFLTFDMGNPATYQENAADLLTFANGDSQSSNLLAGAIDLSSLVTNFEHAVDDDGKATLTLADGRYKYVA